MKSKWNYLLLAPALLLTLLVVFIPGVLTFVVSFTDWDGMSLSPNFIGLRNFTEMAGDWVFWKSLGNNIKWMLLAMTIPVAIGLLTAVLLLNKRRGKSVFQLIFLIPYVLSSVINVIVWQNVIYNPIFGVVGYLNRNGWQIPSLLSNTGTALYAVEATYIWHYWGFLTVVYLASLRQTSRDQVEAAQLEGATGWKLFRYVYFPSILPTFKLMMVMAFINSFMTFDYINLMTSGGPAHATEMLSTYAYTFAFSSMQVGKASAAGLVISAFGLVGSLIYNKLSADEG